MKAIFSTAITLGLIGLTAMPAFAAEKVCLNLKEIRSSEPAKDGSAITFQMSDGKVWRNDLQTPCSDLQFNGFAWVIRGIDQVCDSEQSIKVLRSPQTCQLGKFTQLSPAPRG